MCIFLGTTRPARAYTGRQYTHIQLTLTLTRRCQCHPFSPLPRPPYRYNTARTTTPAPILVIAATAITYRSLRIRCRHVPIANVVVVRLLQLRRRRACAPRDMWCRRLNLSPFPLGADFFRTWRGNEESVPCFVGVIDVSQDFVMISPLPKFTLLGLRRRRRFSPAAINKIN